MFSKLFGKKPSPPKHKDFYPENRLEALLMQAANDASARPEFFKELLAADLFVLIIPGEYQAGRFVAQSGDVLSIKGVNFEGRNRIPVFTSERRLREFIQTNDHQAKLNGQALLSMIAARNEEIILNPTSSYGKEFTKEEIASLVNGSMFQPKKHVIDKETKVLIGTPKEYPAHVVKALIAYFQKSPEVKKAYVAQIHDPNSSEVPHLIFAIQVDGDFRPIASDLGLIFQSTLKAGRFADMIQLGQGGLDDYFKTQKPFFQR